MTASAKIWTTQMPRAADKPHTRAIYLFIIVLLILMIFTVCKDFGDLVYLVAIVGISQYIISLTEERAAFFMLTHSGQEIRLEGKKLIIKTLKTKAETSYALEDFKAIKLRTIFTEWQLKFLYDIIGEVHLLPNAKHKFPLKLIKVRDYKELGNALQREGLELQD